MADAGHAKTEKLIGTIEKRLDRVYGQALKESQEKLEKYLKEHEEKNQKMLDKLSKGKITQDTYDKWVKEEILTGKKYETLVQTMAADLATVDQKAMSIVNGYTPEAYAINRNFSAFELEQAGVPLGATFTLYDRHTVEKLVKENTVLLPKPKVDIPKDQRWNKQHIRNAITQGVLQGEPIPKVAKRLEKVVGMNRSAAIRNARTAMTGAQNAGRIDSYRDAKKKGVNIMNEWLASHDGLTRDSHLDVDGERVEVGATFSNECQYPGDPGGPPEEVYNCRCTLIPYLPDYDFDEKDITEEKFDAWEENHAVSYYKPLDKNNFVNDNFTEQDVDRINERFRELDAKYHANVSDIMTTLERDQREWDLYHDNYVKDLLEKNPHMRKSTAEKRAIEVLGERPNRASVLKGGDYMFSTGEMTLNNSGVKIDGGIAEDILKRQNRLERDQKRLSEGRRMLGFSNVGDTAESTFIHEYGHAIDATYGVSKNEEFLAFYHKFTEEEIKFGVSDYATSNEMEFAAECFTESFMGETQGEMSKEFMRILDRIIGGTIR